jgi:hypothetical protein
VAEDILLGVKVTGDQALGFFKSLATGAQQTAQAVQGIGPAFAGVAQGIQALFQLEKARQSAFAAGTQELQVLQQQIAIQQQAQAGVLSLADATRKLAEAEILAKTGSQQLAAELTAARTLHQQNAQALQQEATAQQALQNAQASAKDEIAELQRKLAIQKQVLAGTISLEQGTRRLAEAEILAKTGSQQLATQLASLRAQTERNTTAMRGLSTSAIQTRAAFQSLNSAAGALGFIGGLAGAALITKQLVTDGLAVSQAYESSGIAIAALLQGTTNLVDQQGKLVDASRAWQVNLRESERIQTKIAEISASTLGTDQELIGVFRTILSFGRGQVATLDEQLTLARGLTNAAKLQGIAGQQIEFEARQILQLETDQGQQVLALLGLSIEQARQYKQQGTLVQELNNRLSIYNTLADSVALTWEGLITSVETFRNLTAKEAFSETFGGLKEILKGMAEEFDRLRQQGGFAAALGADAEQLQALGRALANVMVSVEIAVAGTVNAFLTLAAQFNDTADGADHADQGLQALADTFSGAIQQNVTAAARSIAELIDALKVLVPLIGVAQGAAAGGLIGAVVGGAAGLGVVKLFNEEMNTAADRLTAFADRVDASAKKTDEINAEINKFAKLATDASVGVDVHQVALSALNETLEEAKKEHVGLTAENKKLVDSLSTADAGLKRFNQSLVEDAALLNTQAKLVANAAKEYANLQLRTAEITGDINLFRATKEAEILREKTEEIRQAQLKGIADLTAINEKYETRLRALALDTTTFILKEEKRKTDETLTEIDTRLASQRSANDITLAALSKEIEQLQALQEQAERAGAPLSAQGELLAELNQKQAAFHTVALRAGQAEVAILQQRLGILEKTRTALQAQAGALQGKQDVVSLANLRQLNEAIEDTTQKIQAQRNEINQAQAAISGVQADIQTTEIERGEAQVALTQLYLEQEAKRTQFAQEQAQARADIETQSIQQRIDAIGNQQNLEAATIRLRQEQGAGLDELAEREKNLIVLEQRRAQESIRLAEVQLTLLQEQLDKQHELVDLFSRDLQLKITAGDFEGAKAAAEHLSTAAGNAVELAQNVDKAKLSVDNAKAAFVTLGVEGQAGVAKINNELEQMRSVFDESDLRGLFGDLFDADSLKDAGRILERESKNISKKTFEALLFGKRDNFDAPLLSNINGLFGVGDGGILGQTMQAGGKVQGQQWGNAVTGSAGQTMTSQFPQIASQSLAATEGIFQQQGTALGNTLGQGALGGFESVFGKGIGGILDGVMRLFSSGGGGTSGGGGGIDFGGLVNMFSSWFGSAGSTSATSFNSGFIGNFGQGFGDLSSAVDANSVDWKAAGTSGGSEFGGGFLSGFKGLFGGMGGGTGSTGAGGGSSGFMSWLGLAQSGAQIGSDFSKGNYGAGAGGAVGGVIGAYFGGPQGAAIGAQIGSAIGKIFDDIFNKQGRIDKEKDKIIKYFEKVFDIDFKKISEKKAAAGLQEFADAAPAARALGAIFSEGLKKGDIQGSTVRFAGQLLGNLRRLGEGADEVKEKLLELADAANFDLHDSVAQINAFTQASGADALTLGNFREELQEAKKNLKEYGDTSTLTAKELTDLAAAHGNTGSQIVTYIDLIGGAIDISTRFNEFLNGQVIAQGLAANSFIEAATAAGSTGAAMTDLADKIRTGTLSLEEAAIALNEMRTAAGQAKLSLDELTIDPKKLELIVTVLQSATEGLQNFSAGLTDVLASGLEQGLDVSQAGAKFDEFFNATIRTAIIKAVIGGLVDSLAVEALKPLFAGLGELFTKFVTGAISKDEFKAGALAWKNEMTPALAKVKEGFLEVYGFAEDVLKTIGYWPEAVDDTTNSMQELQAQIAEIQDQITAIDDQLLDIARKKIHVEIDLATKLESIGAITLLAKLDIESKGLQAEFDLLTEKLNAMGAAAGLSVAQLGEAISLVQQLAANVVAKFQAEKAAIDAALKTEIDAIRARGKAQEDAIRAQFAAQRAAIEARIDNLEKEKDLINEAFDARREALEKELQLAQDFQRVGESIQQTINQLVTSNIAPQAPFAQLSFLQRQAAQIRGQIQTAKPEDIPELMERLSQLLQQMAQLQTPNTRPSPEFKALFDSILAELEALQAEAERRGARADTLEEELKQLDIDRNAALAAIDAQIEAARAQLDALSAQEQAALAAAAASIEAEIQAATDKANAKIEELRVTAAEELKRLAEIEKDLLSRQEAVLLSEKDVLLAQLTELQKLNVTAADLLRITASEGPRGSVTPGTTIDPGTLTQIPTNPQPRGDVPALSLIPQFLADTMRAAVYTPPPRPAPDLARPERVQTAPKQSESAPSGPREVKLSVEVRASVEITGTNSPEEAAAKFTKSVKTMLEPELRKFIKGDFVDAVVRTKVQQEMRRG